MADQKSSRCKPSRVIAAAMSMAAALLTSFTARAEQPAEANGFAWHAQTAVIDFASPDSGRQFGDLVEEAYEKTILYLDWTMQNAARSGLFGQIGADDGDPLTDSAICVHVERLASQPDGFTISGKPNPDNNHLLFEMSLDIERGTPFARARCEYVEGANALRLRGFFYVTTLGTATATKLEFQPVSVSAQSIPASLYELLR